MKRFNTAIAVLVVLSASMVGYAAIRTWQSTSSTDYGTGTNNWSGGVVPTGSDTAKINASIASVWPVLDQDRSANILDMRDGSSGTPVQLDVSSHTLTANTVQVLERSGQSGSYVELNGSSGQLHCTGSFQVTGGSGGSVTFKVLAGSFLAD